MFTQESTMKIFISSPDFFYRVASCSPEMPLRASTRDFGFDFNEEDLAAELLAPLPDRFSSDALPQLAPEDFEPLFHWFLA